MRVHHVCALQACVYICVCMWGAHVYVVHWVCMCARVCVCLCGVACADVCPHARTPENRGPSAQEHRREA